MEYEDPNPRYIVEVFDANGDPVVPAPRYSSTEQALRAEVEALKVERAELVRALANVTAEMWGSIDSDDVLIHADPDVTIVNPQTAAAFKRAQALITKYGGAK